jgi:hypothetical protein
MMKGSKPAAKTKKVSKEGGMGAYNLGSGSENSDDESGSEEED